VVHSSNIKIVRELEQVFEPYRILFKELTGKEKETKNAAFVTKFLQRKENKKKKKTKAVFFLGREVNYLGVFTFPGVSWNLTLTKSEAGVSLKYTEMK